VTLSACDRLVPIQVSSRHELLELREIKVFLLLFLQKKKILLSLKKTVFGLANPECHRAFAHSDTGRGAGFLTIRDGRQW
jgi:hypothetical protein